MFPDTGISCDCSQDVDEPAKFYQQEWRTAKKQHKCVECLDPILPGQRYEYVTMLYDGLWDHFKTCLGCYRIRMHWCPSGWYFGMVAEHVEECIGFDYRYLPDDDEEEDDE
jgi:hypothetical protein